MKKLPSLKHMLSILSIIALVLSLNLHASNVLNCNELAGDPFESAEKKGVWLGQINVEKALPACQGAVKKEPDNHKLKYQLARVLLARDLSEGKISNNLHEFITQNIPKNLDIGMLSQSFIKDKKARKSIIKKASEKGDSLATLLYGVYLFNEGQLSEAIKALRKAANAGVADAHGWLAVGILDKNIKGSRKDAYRHINEMIRFGGLSAATDLEVWRLEGFDSTYLDKTFKEFEDKKHPNHNEVIQAYLLDLRRKTSVDYWGNIELGKALSSISRKDYQREGYFWLNVASTKSTEDLADVIRFYLGTKPMQQVKVNTMLKLARQRLKNGENKNVSGDFFDFGQLSIDRWAARIQFENADKSVRVENSVLQSFFKKNGHMKFFSAEKIIDKYNARSLIGDVYKIEVSADDDSLSAHLSRNDGDYKDKCVYASTSKWQTELKNISQNLGNSNSRRYINFEVNIKLSCQPLNPTTIEIECAAVTHCGYGNNKDDYARCSENNKFKTITLPALSRSKKIRTRLYIDPSIKKNVVVRSKCGITKVNGEKRKWSSPANWW